MNEFKSLFDLTRDFVCGPQVVGLAPVPRPRHRCKVRSGGLADLLLIDVSGSMDEDDYPPTRLAGAKQAAGRFLEARAKADSDAVVGIVTFGDEARVVMPFVTVSSNIALLRQVLHRVDISGGTNTGAGLECVHEEMRHLSRDVRRRVILLTDGYHTEGRDPEAVASKLKNDGIQLDIIGIGGSPEEVNEPVLTRMASVVRGQRRYWFIRSVGQLIEKFEALALREIR